MHREMTQRETEEQYRELYGDATNAEIAALFRVYGELIHECPSIIQGLLVEARTKH